MPNYAQISLQVFDRNRADGSRRRFEYRLLERDGEGDTMPFDLNSQPVITTGSNSHDLSATIKPTQISFRIKTITALAEKLRTADDRQYRLTIRELESNEMIFEGYIKPDFPRYDIFKKAKTVQVTATGELGSLIRYDADDELRTLYDVFHRINDESGFPSRETDFYMRTRYAGQVLGDPIPQRLWMTEAGKIADEGTRDTAIRQIAQEFNFQVFQQNGRLVVADVYERLRNPESVIRYLAGTAFGTENLLINVNESNLVRKVAGRDVSPTGQRRAKIARIVQQRALLHREESSFPSVSSPELVGTVNEYSLPGRSVAGDIIRLHELTGTVQLTELFDPGQSGVFRINVRLQLLQFVFVSDVDGSVFYYNFVDRTWETEESWLELFVPIQGNFAEQTEYDPATWRLGENTELAEIPAGHRGVVTLRVQRNVIDSNPVVVNTADIEMTVDRMNVHVAFNDRPDDVYYQSIAENGTGESRVYPLYESDFDIYTGENQVMRIGAGPEPDMADSEWIHEEDESLIAFNDLTARRKAWLQLGSADRIHIIVNDTTPVSMLNVLHFQGNHYLPVCIKYHLFSGHQEIWMIQAPGLSYDFTSRYTYTPEDLTSVGDGVSRGWVNNRIIDSMNSSLAAGAIARTVHDLTGLVESITLDRENLLAEGAEIRIINPFSLDSFHFTVAQDQQGQVIFVDAKGVGSIIPAGSYVFGDAGAVASGILQTQYATRIFSEFAGVGVLREDVNAVFSEMNPLPLHLFVQVRQGWSLRLLNEEDGTIYNISPGGEEGSRYQGTVDVPISGPPQLIQAPAGSRVTLSNTQLSAFFHVDPGAIRAGQAVTNKGDAIGTLSADREGTIASVALQDVNDIVDLQDGQVLRLINREGENEQVIVDGDQTVTPPTHTIDVQETTLAHEYTAAHAWLREPSYRQSARLTIEAARINANVESITEQGTAIAGIVLDVSEANTAIASVNARVDTVEGDVAQAYIDMQAYADGEIASAAISIMAEVSNDIGSAVSGLASQSYVDSEVASATANLVTEAAMGSAFSSAQSSWESYTDGEISSATASIMTNVSNDIGSAVSGLASESYVDSEVASATANLVTEAEMGSAFSSAQSSWESYTDGEVSSATASIMTNVNNDISSAVAGLATESYVDDEITSAEVNIFAEVDNNYVGISIFNDTVNGGLITITGETIFEDDVDIRGRLTVTELVTRMEVQGEISNPDRDFVLDAGGLKLRAGSGNLRRIRWINAEIGQNDNQNLMMDMYCFQDDNVHVGVIRVQAVGASRSDLFLTASIVKVPQRLEVSQLQVDNEVIFNAPAQLWLRSSAQINSMSAFPAGRVVYNSSINRLTYSGAGNGWWYAQGSSL